MSGLLLDSHVAIWIGNGESIAQRARLAIEEAYRRDAVYVSAMSAWEITHLAVRDRISVTPPRRFGFCDSSS